MINWSQSNVYLVFSNVAYLFVNINSVTEWLINCILLHVSLYIDPLNDWYFHQLETLT